MGIARYVAEAIVREHKFKPIVGDVLLLGRQTMYFSPQQAIDLIRACGVEPASIPVSELAIDQQTRASSGHTYILDSDFFRLLGVPKIRALDHSDYEGADIVHDLNVPTSESLEGIADFILDGSTLDNLFNPGTALQSIARMLRPHGRLLAVNMGSHHYSPYLVFTPFWFVDFFAINNFADSRIYVTLHGTGEKGINAFVADPKSDSGHSFIADRVVGIMAFAEKGPGSTWNRLPIQRAYSSPETLAVYQSVGNRMAQSKRPEIMRSTTSRPVWRSSGDTAIWQMQMYADNVKHFAMITPSGERWAASLPFLQRVWRALPVPIRKIVRQILSRLL